MTPQPPWRKAGSRPVGASAGSPGFSEGDGLFFSSVVGFLGAYLSPVTAQFFWACSDRGKIVGSASTGGNTAQLEGSDKDFPEPAATGKV